MSTKVFSTRLDEDTIREIKEFSLATKTSIPKSLKFLIKTGKETIEKKNDPWLEFSRNMDIGDDFELVVANKREKNRRARIDKKNMQND